MKIASLLLLIATMVLIWMSGSFLDIPWENYPWGMEWRPLSFSVGTAIVAISLLAITLHFLWQSLKSEGRKEGVDEGFARGKGNILQRYEMNGYFVVLGCTEWGDKIIAFLGKYPITPWNSDAEEGLFYCLQLPFLKPRTILFADPTNIWTISGDPVVLTELEKTPEYKSGIRNSSIWHGEPVEKDGALKADVRPLHEERLLSMDTLNRKPAERIEPVVGSAFTPQVETSPEMTAPPEKANDTETPGDGQP